MPKIFVETGHVLTDLVIDATEFKFQSASDFELNYLMFSDYKNTQTRKALVGEAEYYLVTISNSKITEECDAVNLVEWKHEIMSDCGFSIQELCAS